MLNCQSINAQIYEIKIKQMESVNCTFDAIFLEESWLSNDADLSMFKLDNYNIISKGKLLCSAHGSW